MELRGWKSCRTDVDGGCNGNDYDDDVCAGVDEQRSSERVDSVDELSSSVSDASSRTSRLSSSYYALIAWLGLVTVALLTATVLTVYRRLRRPVTESLDVVSVSTCNDSSTSSVQLNLARPVSAATDHSASANS